MKTNMKWLLASVLILLIGGSCKKTFSDLYVNKNKPTSVPASLIFNGTLNLLLDAPGGQNDRTNQYQIQNNSYFGNNQYTFGSGDNFYPTMISGIAMDSAALAAGAGPVNPYEALNKFFNAYFAAKMSL